MMIYNPIFEWVQGSETRWLRVPYKYLEKLGLSKRITPWSKRLGDKEMLLEASLDARRFQQAWEHYYGELKTSEDKSGIDEATVKKLKPYFP